MSTIPEPLKIQIISVVAQNLNIQEIDIPGRHLDPKFKAHLLSGEPFGITLRPDLSARTLKHIDSRGLLTNILSLLVRMHSYQDTTIIGRVASLQGPDTIIQNPGMMGLKLDPMTGTPVEARNDGSVNWGFLKEGEFCHLCHLSIYIAGKSQLQIRYPKSGIEVVYNNFYTMLKRIVKVHNGQVWNRAGGIVTF